MLDVQNVVSTRSLGQLSKFVLQQCVTTSRAYLCLHLAERIVPQHILRQGITSKEHSHTTSTMPTKISWILSSISRHRSVTGCLKNLLNEGFGLLRVARGFIYPLTQIRRSRSTPLSLISQMLCQNWTILQTLALMAPFSLGEFRIARNLNHTGQDLMQTFWT